MATLEKVERRTGRAVVVRGADIDTDQIIPARYMTSIRFAGLEEHVFHDARFSLDGSAKDHPFNDRRFSEASILVVGRNFGCGSSREHAPQALMRWGIRAIIGESFAEIFFGNCISLGIPPVTADPADVEALMDSVELDPTQEVAIDLVTMTARSRAGQIRLALPEAARRALVEGTWDAMRVLLLAQDEIQTTADRLPYVRGF